MPPWCTKNRQSTTQQAGCGVVTASIWATRISRNAVPAGSTPSVPIISTLTSTTTGVNYHRPRFFPETITDDKGKERKKYRYKDMMTPYEKFKSIPDASQHLKDGITLEKLDAQAAKMSANNTALALNNARIKNCLETSLRR